MAIIEGFKAFSGMNDFQVAVFIIFTIVVGSILFSKKMKENDFRRKFVRFVVCVLCLCGVIATLHFTEIVCVTKIVDLLI